LSKAVSKRQLPRTKTAIVTEIPKRGQSRLRPWMLVALIILAIAVIRVRLLNVPLERDEGEYAYAGQLMLQGIPPYQLAFNMKFPGTYAAYALIMAIFGQTIAGIHLGFLLVNAGTIVLIYLLGKRLVTSAAGVASAAAYAILSIGSNVLGPEAHATHFVVISAVAGILVLLRALEDKSSTLLFSSGLLFGIAALMKQHGIIFAAFGALFLGWNLWREGRSNLASLISRLGAYLCGVIAPLAFTLAVLWRAGVFDKFWFWTVTYAREYALEVPIADGVAHIKYQLPNLVGPNLGIWIVAAAGLALVWWKHRDRGLAVFLTGFLVFSFLAVCPGLYFREHYFVLMLPAIALLAGTAVACAQRIRPRSSMLVYGVFAAAMLFSVFEQRHFLFEVGPLEFTRERFSSNPFPEAIEMANYIRTHSSPAARIAVLGSEPEIPFYANRHSATGYIYTYGLMEPQPFALTMQNEMIRDFESAQPDFVVVVNVSTSWLRRPDSSTRLFDWWNTYRLANYHAVGVADISSDQTVYQWDRQAAIYQPKSPFVVWLFKRSNS